MPVFDAVTAELERMGARAAESVEASVALALAEKLDRRVTWADAKELRETMVALRALLPPVKQEDGVDEIAKRRAQRVSGASAEG
jgi:hypothetical protein